VRDRTCRDALFTRLAIRSGPRHIDAGIVGVVHAQKSETAITSESVPPLGIYGGAKLATEVRGQGLRYPEGIMPPNQPSIDGFIEAKKRGRRPASRKEVPVAEAGSKERF
jgi:hypothetical protein